MESFEETVINLTFKPTGQFTKNLMLKILDFLLWNRSQIPFTFEVLQNFVNTENGTCYKTISQFNKAKSTYDNILAVKQIIEAEFFNTKSFFIIFGSTIMTAKEAFKIKFPAISSCIFPSYNELMQNKVLLELIQADNFKNLFSNPLGIETNVFILFERFDDEGLTQGLCKIKNFKLNKSCKKYAISFNHSSDFEIFCEDIEELNLNAMELKENDDYDVEKEEVWYQSKIFIKGFNKIIASSI